MTEAEMRRVLLVTILALAAPAADDGPGVPAEERERIFRRLHRLERSRSTPGGGLGLALVAAVAELHGARIAAEDAGPGLRVVVDFPPDRP